jgi:hypothetical protein
MKTTIRLFLIVSLAMMLGSPAWSATIMVFPNDPPGVGFNDPTVVAPVGGNSGTTLGEQRLIVFQKAAVAWGEKLESDVPIRVWAQFAPLACTPTSGTLGAAGAAWLVWDGALGPTVHPIALANAKLGVNTIGDPDFGLFPYDIFAFFNGAIGTQPNCLTGLNWYNGLDHNESPTELDLLSVVMHEFTHGLGFFETTERGGAFNCWWSFGEFPEGYPDVYARNLYGTTVGKRWDQMNPSERCFSRVNNGGLVWVGNNVTNAAPSVLGPRPTVAIAHPRPMRGIYEAADATFAPQPPVDGGQNRPIYMAQDYVYPSSSDACEPILNWWQVAGNNVLIDRGACAFQTKAYNAWQAGAAGAIIVNNDPRSVFELTPVVPFFIPIPVVMVSQADGAKFKSALPYGLSGRLYRDSRFMEGANRNGNVRMYASTSYQPGSSTSHWDTLATPNLLMEPFITGSTAPSEDLDLTVELMKDIGWPVPPEEPEAPWWSWW